MPDSSDSAYRIVKLLGPPTRFVFKESPITLYVETDGEFEVVRAHSVDFEIACDLYDIKDANEQLVYNSHVRNIIEPGCGGDEIECYISHAVVLDDVSYQRLLAYANTKGCKSYTGVVDGYSVDFLRNIYDGFDILDTGICLSEKFILHGGLMTPGVPFNETKHKRFVQKSMAIKNKFEKLKSRGEIIPKREVYSPIIYKMNCEELAIG